MKFMELVKRIRGLSCPIFGISWNPPESEVANARRIIAYFEDRRVLYNSYKFEVPNDCINSIIDIRKHITDEIGKLDDNSELKNNLKGIRAECRKFLNESQNSNVYMIGPRVMDPLQTGFFTKLGELRSAVGFYIATIAIKYGLDVEGDLSSILPESDEIQ